MDEKELKEHLENVSPEERAAAWEKYVRDEVNALLDTFLPEAIAGNVGIKYDHPVKRVSAQTGQKEFDEKVAKGVIMTIMFDFAAPITFFDKNPEDAE